MVFNTKDSFVRSKTEKERHEKLCRLYGEGTLQFKLLTSMKRIKPWQPCLSLFVMSIPKSVIFLKFSYEPIFFLATLHNHFKCHVYGLSVGWAGFVLVPLELWSIGACHMSYLWHQQATTFHKKKIANIVLLLWCLFFVDSTVHYILYKKCSINIG